MAARELRVAVGGGHTLTRSTLAELIDRLPGLHAAPLESASDPDVLVWDAEPDDPPFAELQARFPDVPVVAVAGRFTLEWTLGCLQEGALACVTKSEPQESLSLAIRQVARGEIFLPLELDVELLAVMRSNSTDVPPDEPGLSLGWVGNIP